MTRDDLPPADNPAAVLEFARSFNGYEHHGSFEACSRAARARKRDTIEDLRNDLFFQYRTLNHLGMDSTVLAAYYRDDLLPHFRRLLG